ncbi:GLYCINE-RICH PROTEIN DOT1-LIKE [Salix viminalis]|uniref:GLYCINE-RICH PROTEIN DOT1-LIKE n=1 Tax=Salix viminalis TaxID=40686 RepID=A0A9Q0TYE9_SALVM|nr:GLYCINE-RICH PROTEIN DOT1-LIKE [Salix viminalis]
MHRRRKMGFLLRLLVITSLCLSASSAPLDDKPFLSDPLLENNLGATGTHGISSVHDDSNERSGIVHSSKFAHGGSSAHGHGRGGGAADNGHGRGGGAQGGRAAVPVIIAGAAANHRPNNHHNAGNRQANCLVPTTLITTTFVALIVH